MESCCCWPCRLIDDAQQRIELEAATQQAADGGATADSKPAGRKVRDLWSWLTDLAPPLEVAADKVLQNDELCVQVGQLPAGGFLTHLLKANNPLIGRPFTKMEMNMQAYTFLLAGKQHFWPLNVSAHLTCFLWGDAIWCLTGAQAMRPLHQRSPSPCTMLQPTMERLRPSSWQRSMVLAAAKCPPTMTWPRCGHCLSWWEACRRREPPTEGGQVLVQLAYRSSKACLLDWRRQIGRLSCCAVFAPPPEAQECCLNTQTLFPDNPRASECCLQFPYLTAVWLEALRLSPPGGLGTIRLARNAQDVGGYSMPEGTAFIVCF